MKGRRRATEGTALEAMLHLSRALMEIAVFLIKKLSLFHRLKLEGCFNFLRPFRSSIYSFDSSPKRHLRRSSTRWKLNSLILVTYLKPFDQFWSTSIFVFNFSFFFLFQLKAFYVDLLVPLETNLEKDTKVVQVRLKTFSNLRSLQIDDW